MVSMYDKDKDKALNREEWQDLLNSMASFTKGLDIAVAAVRLDGKGESPRVAWKQGKNVPEVPSPLYHEGRLYLVSEKGIVTCRDAKTGKETYRQRLGGRGACYSSPVLG